MSLRLNHFLGALFLVAGTTIGAGMLAMPTTNAFSGCFWALIFLAFSWAFMLGTAFLLIDVTLHIKKKAHLISMTESLLGEKAKAVCGVTYLLLLYSLTAAYISGASRLLQTLFLGTLPSGVYPFLLPLILVFAFSWFLSFGMRSIDLVNRILMVGLLFSYLILLVFLPSRIEPSLLAHSDLSAALFGIPVMITSFGFHIVIPSLALYMEYQKKPLQKAVFWGSVLPLFVYVLWEIVTLGIIPLRGEVSFFSALQTGGAITETLVALVGAPYIQLGALLFSLFAMLTSLLGISISLIDFLRDGLRKRQQRYPKSAPLFFTFIPPLLFTLFYQQGFLLALEYAAVFVAILLGMFPVFLAWKLPQPSVYRSLWGRVYLIVLFIISCAIIVCSFLPTIPTFQNILQTCAYESLSS